MEICCSKHQYHPNTHKLNYFGPLNENKHEESLKCLGAMNEEANVREVDERSLHRSVTH